MIELCSKKECTGCGACHDICPKHAITMRQDKEGFFFPEIDPSLCVECTLCQKACHVLFPVKKHKRVEYPLAAVAKSDLLRQKSSSGGMFSLLALEIIAKGGVVFGAVFGDDYEVYHTKATNEQELAALRGSKYIQSRTENTYQEVKMYLKKGINVLYTGTPCQIAGLYGFLGKIDTTLLYTVDLVCHGVPSIKAFHLYLKKLAIKENCNVHAIKNFSFRDLKGWDITPSYRMEGKEDVNKQPVLENLYMRMFLSSFLHRECCYHCRYTTEERVADITIADFWGVEKEKAFAYDITKGCSLVLLNSEKGDSLFQAVSQNLYYEERTWSEALAQNHQLYTSSIRPKGRNNVYAYMENHTYDKIYNHYFNTPYLRFRHLVGSILRYLHLRK